MAVSSPAVGAGDDTPGLEGKGGEMVVGVVVGALKEVEETTFTLADGSASSTL